MSCTLIWRDSVGVDSQLANLSFSLPIKKKSNHLGVAFQPLSLLQLTPTSKSWTNVHPDLALPFVSEHLGNGVKPDAYRQTLDFQTFHFYTITGSD